MLKIIQQDDLMQQILQSRNAELADCIEAVQKAVDNALPRLKGVSPIIFERYRCCWQA
jgi:hypothetical protein